MLTNPVLLITGGSRGLGRAMAFAFAKKGYAVAINYEKEDSAAREVEKLMKEEGNPLKLIRADVRCSDQTNRMLNEIQSDWGRLDVLINNAGISKDRSIMKMSDKEWEDVIDVNLNGTFRCTRAVIPLMRKEKKGSIINILSYLAKKPGYGAANYAASKAGILSLTQSAALELARYGIRVNGVFPGFHVTDMNRNVWEKNEESIREQHLLPTLPTKEGLGEFVYHLAHLETVTGQVFPFESRLI
ncbi:hypothetical protein BVX98_07090 [bacterium F11]|nr:hypothetical protein BVX98_07090 [bacterium F11]